jgi:branched-chain amino acid transport system ATP-binding protein
MTAPVLQVRNIATGYGDLRSVWDVSFDVQAARTTALLGRNGAGKTTTLRAIVGLNRLWHGSVRFDGVDLDRTSTPQRIKMGIGLVQEGKRIFRQRTVEENLLIGGYSLGLSRRRLPQELSRVYDLFPALAERRKLSAAALSGGQQQMVAIGQALMAKPKLLMLDEPSAGLAPAVVAEVMASVASLKSTGLAILLVEQAVETAVALADDVVVIDVGRVTLACEASAVHNADLIRQAYFGPTH